MLRTLSLLAALAAFGHAGPGLAHEFTLGALTIDHPWARPTSAGMPNGAAYMVVRNAGPDGDRLVAAATEVAQRVEIHTSLIDAQGVAMMREIEAVDIPAGGETAIAPGGLHLMLVGLRQSLAEGANFPLTLTFEQAGEAQVTVSVEKGMGGMHGHGQGHGAMQGHDAMHGHGHDAKAN